MTNLKALISLPWLFPKYILILKKYEIFYFIETKLKILSVNYKSVLCFYNSRHLKIFQVIRDLFLMIPDVLNIVIPLLELRSRKHFNKNLYADDPSSFKEILFLVIIVISGLIVVSLL